MKKGSFFKLSTLGWLMILFVLLLLAVYSVASDDELYYRLQSEAQIADSAGVSEADLRLLDARLSEGLFAPVNADAAFDNREIEVFGVLQPPFNERELRHLYDCRKLLSPTQPALSYFLLLTLGILLLLCGGGFVRREGVVGAWLAAALILLPIVVLGVWAAIDFGAAFTFFHRLLFANDLWLLDPETDLLIRICPSSMFADMGLKIGLRSAASLLGVPTLATLVYKLQKRKRERNEISVL